MTSEDNKNKILAGTTAVNNRDIEGFTRLLEPGFKLFLIVKPEQLLPQGRVSGPEGFATYLNMLYTAFSDVVFHQESVQAQGNMVHQEFLIIGKHTGPLQLPNGTQVPPTGLKIRLPVEVFHTFNNQGGFVSSTGYVNLLDIMKQFKNRSGFFPHQAWPQNWMGGLLHTSRKIRLGRINGEACAATGIKELRLLRPL